MTTENSGRLFVAGGSLAGFGLSTTVGGMGLVGSFGGVGLGVAPVTLAGGVVGAAAWGDFLASVKVILPHL